MFDQLTITHSFRQRIVCVRPPCTNISTQRTVCDIHTYRNVFLGFTVWDVHTYGIYFLGFTVSDVHTYGNDFLGFTVWDVHTYGNDWVSMPRPIAHGPSLCPRRAYPRRFLGHVGRTPLSPTLTWRRFQMPSRKGVLNRLFRTSLYQCGMRRWFRSYNAEVVVVVDEEATVPK